MTDSNDTHIKALFDWVTEHGGSGDKIQIQAVPEIGNGVVAKQALAAGESYIHIPAKLIITDKVCREIVPADSKLEGRPLMCAFLVHERFVNKQSFWKPYIDVLPKEFSTPVFFCSEEIKFLEGTPAKSSVDEMREQYRKEYERAVEEVGESVIPRSVFTFEAYLWAVAVCTSRSFTDDLVKDHEDARTARNAILLPLMDMVNHYPKSKVTWRHGPDGIDLVTEAGLAAGQQALNNYGPKSNEELMLGYGFCIEGNPFDFFHVKLNYTSDPMYEQKRQVLESVGLGELQHCITREAMTKDLLPILRVLAMNETDMHYLGAVKREDLEDCGLRVELNARHLLLVLLAQQQQKFEAAEANLPDIETANTRVARMYRKGVHEAILSTIEELVSSVQKLCALGCDLVANDSHALPKYIMAGGMSCNTASSETDTEDSSRSKRARVESSLEQFLSTVLITEAAFESDSEFALAAAQVDVDEDTLLALFVIRLLHNPSSAWHAAIKRLEDFKHPMLVAGQSEEYAEMLMELYEIHEALFPVLSETFPEVFPAEQFSLDGFLWAAGVVSALDVRVVVRSDGAAAGGLCVV